METKTRTTTSTLAETLDARTYRPCQGDTVDIDQHDCGERRMRAVSGEIGAGVVYIS